MSWPAVVDGALSPDRSVRLDVLGGGLNGGAGIFETLKVRDGEAEWWEAHLRRLRSGADWLGWECPSEARLADDLALLLGAIEASSWALRILLFREGDRIRRALAAGPLPAVPEALFLGLADPSLQGPRDLAFLKASSYLKSSLALELGRKSGFDEVLFCREDQILEGSRSSIFLCRDGTVLTPPADGAILPGVLRAAVLGVCAREGINVREEGFTLSELEDADEAFLTSSLMGVRPVRSFRGRVYRVPGELTGRISRAVNEGSRA